MGLLDIPAPLFERLDGMASALLPSWLRLVLWGGTAALASMAAYRMFSAQDRIRRGKRLISQAQQRLNAYDGELNGAWPLMADLLGLSLRQVVRVGWPAILASLPLLFLLNWLSTAYGYAYPPAGAAIQLQTVPARFRAQWVTPHAVDSGASPHIIVLDDNDRIVADARVVKPVPVIHKRKWWNALIANPSGYLPADTPVERIEARFPRQEHLMFGPHWMRGWEIIFFSSLLAVSIGLKVKLKIA